MDLKASYLFVLLKYFLLVLIFSGCAVSTPYRSMSSLSPDGTVIVSVTHAIVKDEGRSLFDRYVDQIIASLSRQPGLVGYRVRTKLLGNEVWTMTYWKDESARAAFVSSEIHTRAMKAGIPTLVSARFYRFERPSSSRELTWEEALYELQAKGRSYEFGKYEPK